MRPLRIAWRRELLLLSILGMEATWLTPWTGVLTGTLHAPARAVPLGALLLLLLVALLGARALTGSGLPLGAQQAAAGVFAILSGLTLVGACLYAGRPPASGGWGLAWLRDLARLQTGGIGGLVLLGVALYAWGRGISLAQGHLGTDKVGYYLRVGVVAWFWFYIRGLAARDDTPAGWVFLFFFLGILAVGLARVEEVHQEKGALRSPFTASWLLILAGSALGVLGLAFLGTRTFSRSAAGRAWLALAPLGRVLYWLLYQVIRALFWLVGPLLNWLHAALAPAAERLTAMPVPLPTPFAQPATQPQGLPPSVQAALWALAALGALAVVFLVVAGLRRREAEGLANTQAEATWEAAPGGGDEGLGPALRRLGQRLTRALSSRPRGAYGLGSVRQIYASLLHLAAGHGVPREEAETPYEFGGRLDRALPGVEGEVAAITEAYVQARYGGRRASAEEVEALRARWQRLRETVEGPGS